MAAENGALPRGKIGGLGDVIRDLPLALAERGCDISVVTPAYGVFGALPGAKLRGRFDTIFAGSENSVGILELPPEHAGVTNYVLDHPRLAPRGPGLIYTDDAMEGPFATDASKFAFFCAAAATAVIRGALPVPAVLHLHDWQAALVLFLREFDPAHSDLKAVRSVFTIHNLSIQGTRPLSGDESALESWFPGVDYDREVVADPRWTDCVNPVAVGIRLADAVNTVSPSYAREILEPSDPARGYWGGEGLERDLLAAQKAGRLSGILNGCAYPATVDGKPAWGQVLDTLREEVSQWIARDSSISSAHYLADKRLARLGDRRPPVLLTSIGRIRSQKVQLLRQATDAGTSALEAILEMLASDGLFILIGSGDADYEHFLSAVAARDQRLLFLNGYSDSAAELLYACGDLFLMPSSFEPCGISQMLAMRAGQICVVHGVGGLKDTVTDDVNGFVFGGDTPAEQVSAFVAKVRYALELRRSSIGRWQRVQQAAAAARFTWDEAAAAYEKTVYGFSTG